MQCLLILITEGTTMITIMTAIISRILAVFIVPIIALLIILWFWIAEWRR